MTDLQTHCASGWPLRMAISAGPCGIAPWRKGSNGHSRAVDSPGSRIVIGMPRSMEEMEEEAAHFRSLLEDMEREQKGTQINGCIWRLSSFCM